MSSPNSIVREGREVTFTLAQDKLRLQVVYSGIDPLPDTFKDGAQALADGKLGPDGVFQRHARSRPSALRSMKPSRTMANRPMRVASHAAILGIHSWKTSARSRSCWRFVSPSTRFSDRWPASWAKRPFLVLSAERAVYSHLGAADHRRRAS